MCKGKRLAEVDGERLAELGEVRLQRRHSTAMREEWVDAGGAPAASARAPLWNGCVGRHALGSTRQAGAGPAQDSGALRQLTVLDPVLVTGVTFFSARW